jgi:hypothetical protein
MIGDTGRGVLQEGDFGQHGLRAGLQQICHSEVPASGCGGRAERRARYSAQPRRNLS